MKNNLHFQKMFTVASIWSN